MDIFCSGRLELATGGYPFWIGQNLDCWMVIPCQAELVTEPLTFGPSSALGWLQVGMGVAVLCVTATADPAGRFLLGPASALLVTLGVRDLVLRPTLSAGRDGLTVVDGLHRRVVTWAEVEQVRVVTDRRAPLLELDLGDTVVVLSRRRLRMPPSLVLEQLEQLRADQSS